MSDYKLYYWSVPFRGQFIRAILAFAGASWTEMGDGKIGTLMEGDPADMPVPFMGPPVLVDRKAGFAVSQMPAIALYLGQTLKLLPSSPAETALAIKVVNDANDVIDEITLNGGQQMWTDKRWKEFVPRLKKWASLWEDLGRRHGLKAERGYLLGSSEPGIADVVTATLWSTLSDRFPKIDKILDKAAPNTMGLTRRVAAMPALAALAEKARADYGDAYCGGQIEASLRKVLE